MTLPQKTAAAQCAAPGHEGDAARPLGGKTMIPDPSPNGKDAHPLLMWYVYHAEEREELRAHGLDAAIREEIAPDDRHVIILVGAGDFYAISRSHDDAQWCYSEGAL